jgi:hypothetical protein
MSEQEQLIAELKEIINHPHWRAVEALLNGWLTNDFKALAAYKRPDGPSDDFIKGQIDRTRALLNNPRSLVKSHELEKLMNSQESEPPPLGSPYRDDSETS